MDEATQAAGNGHTEPKYIRLTLRSGKPWNCPAEIAREILETLARDEPVKFGRALQGALMGETPQPPGRKRNGGGE